MNHQEIVLTTQHDKTRSNVLEDSPVSSGRIGHLYFCQLCDESLVFSPQSIHPEKIVLAFNKICPSCGFELNDQLGYQELVLPMEATIYTNRNCIEPNNLLDQVEFFKPAILRGSSIDRKLQPGFSTGIRHIDDKLNLNLGQLAVLKGKQANQITLIVAARAIAATGTNDNAVFIDGGNSFDTYTLFKHAATLGLGIAQARDRVHVSRAFTYHQLATLIKEELPAFIQKHRAKIVCVLDITLLYADPDVRDEIEAMAVFRDNLRFLAKLASQTNSLIIVTNLESRNRRMDAILTRFGRTVATMEQEPEL